MTANESKKIQRNINLVYLHVEVKVFYSEILDVAIK